MEFATLSFAIESERLVEEEYQLGSQEPVTEGAPYLSVLVHPLVNGKKLTSGYAVDIRALVGYGARATTLDIYTCSCGVAGCAGIFDDVHLGVDGTSVTWTFPEAPFRQKFDPELFPAGSPLLVRFNKAQYVQALANLESQLYEMTLASELPLALVPYAYPDLTRTIGQELAGARRWADTLLARIAERKSLFQHLYDAALELEWPNGSRRRAWVASLADSLAYQLAEARNGDIGGDEDPRADILAEEVVPTFLASEESLFAKVKELDWTEARTMLWRVDKGPKPQGDGWHNATLRLVAGERQ